jgi:DNA-binding NarL/FixJ family response regulator
LWSEVGHAVCPTYFMTVRTLLVDDFEGWRHTVRELLRESPELQVICEVADGIEAVQKAGELKPDLIVLDIGLPKLNGIEAARQILELLPSSKIIFLSQENSFDPDELGLRRGAVGFVHKARAQSELLPAIEAVLPGYRFTHTRGEKAPHRHEVLFYSNDAVFLDSFARFIAAALEAGNVAVALATESHQEGLVHKLKARGIDIDAAIQQGTYIPLDVAKTLSTFMVNDLPDSDRFFEVVGGFIRAAAKAGKRERPRVVACGECAPSLWAEGKVDAAIRLERLWDQIVLTYEVDTLCGYALSTFHGEEDEHVFQSICAEHSAVDSH